MFDSAYNFNCVGYTRSAKKNIILGIRHFSFSTPKHRYLVEAEQYINHIYIVQYYPAKYKKHTKKYMLLTHEFKCMPIIGTCIKIMLSILEKDKLATFSFIGANTYDPISDTEEGIDRNQRWKVYKYAMEAKMGTEIFTHAMVPALSRYVMINKQQDIDFMLYEIDRIFNLIYEKGVC